MDPMDGSISVAVVRRVKPGCEAAYEAWLHHVITAARAYPGHLGADVLKPPTGSSQYTLLFRYETVENLLTWENSEDRQRLLAEAEPLVEGAATVQKMSGLETWFTLPGGAVVKPPPRWKMAAVTWAVAFPLIQLLNATVVPPLHALPPLLRGAIAGALMVLTMTYAAMPLAVRALAGWLYPPGGGG